MGIHRTSYLSYLKHLSKPLSYCQFKQSYTNLAMLKRVANICTCCHVEMRSVTFPYKRQCQSVRTFHTSQSFLKNKSRYTEEFGNEDMEELEEEDEDSDEIDDNPLLEISGDVGISRRVFIIHPAVRKPHDAVKEDELTTPELQLAECHALVETLQDWKVTDEMILSVRPKQRFIFGKQQMHQVTNHIRGQKDRISSVFVNVNLLQINQLALFQGAWKVPVYDRYAVVLQIFKEHAQTKEAKLQIALAEIPFVRNRLPSPDEAGQHSLQGTSHTVCFGGFSTKYTQMTELLLARREFRLKKAINKLKEQRQILRKNRQKKEFPTVAVVGYTNCGKTTLIKALTGDEKMEPRNQLFATLDVTVHAGILPNNTNVLYIDTIGFISDIPMGLIKAFSATLEDAVMADVVLHVRDGSHPDQEAQNINVLQTLKQILPEDKMDKIIVVKNKTDLISSSTIDESEDNSGEMYISAVTGLGLDKLRDRLQVSLFESCHLLEKKFRVPFDGEHLSWLYREATVTNTEASDDSESMIIHTIISKANYEKFKHRFSKKRSQS